MSLGTKLASVKRLVQEVRKWPDDSMKVYASISLRKNLLEKYEKVLDGGSASKLPAAHIIDNEATAANMLGRNLNQDTYPLSERALRPSGMGNYYQRIVDESNKGKKKDGFFKSVWTVAFGWAKR